MSDIKNTVADHAAYLSSVFEFKHRVCAMLTARADSARSAGKVELAAEYRQAALRAAVAVLSD